MWLVPILRAAAAGVAYAVGALLELYPDDRGFRLHVRVGAGVFVVLVVLVIEYFESVRPARRLTKARDAILGRLSAELLQGLRRQGLHARMNLMVPFRPLRFLFLRRYFRMVWGSGMEDEPDVNITFPISHGVVGECFRTKRPVFATRAQLETTKFPRRLKDAVKDVNEVCAFPVYEPARGNAPQRGRVLAVLSLDSKATTRPAAGTLIGETPTGSVIPEVLRQRLSDLAAMSAQLV